MDPTLNPRPPYAPPECSDEYIAEFLALLWQQGQFASMEELTSVLCRHPTRE